MLKMNGLELSKVGLSFFQNIATYSMSSCLHFTVILCFLKLRQQNQFSTLRHS
ncbi:hypothetical protein JCM18900_12973 [Psychrobacter sp. JCM 18900]|nr:hypothetical protein JCM18900_12973 [Psychrobacter sp. JCM 18900]